MDSDRRLGSFLCPICGGDVDVRTNDDKTVYHDHRDCEHDVPTDDDLIYRDEQVAEYTHLCVVGLADTPEALRLNEAIRNAIDIQELRIVLEN